MRPLSDALLSCHVRNFPFRGAFSARNTFSLRVLLPCLRCCAGWRLGDLLRLSALKDLSVSLLLFLMQSSHILRLRQFQILPKTPTEVRFSVKKEQFRENPSHFNGYNTSSFSKL